MKGVTVEQRPQTRDREADGLWRQLHHGVGTYARDLSVYAVSGQRLGELTHDHTEPQRSRNAIAGLPTPQRDPVTETVAHLATIASGSARYVGVDATPGTVDAPLSFSEPGMTGSFVNIHTKYV
jgi:hypothetical protein